MAKEQLAAYTIAKPEPADVEVLVVERMADGKYNFRARVALVDLAGQPVTMFKGSIRAIDVTGELPALTATQFATAIMPLVHAELA